MSETAPSADDFRRACGLWATGVSIVTTAGADGTPYGLTMNAVSSLSLDPPMFLVCVDLNSDTLAPMLESRVYCVNVLTSAQEDLSNRFAKKGADKFEGVAFSRGVGGVPVLDGVLLAVECAVASVLDGGDHHIVCGAVKNLRRGDEGAAPLLYYGGRYAALAGA
ncbi:MAG: flavin reductase family protein [Gammaproteobacteria bacterium]